MYRPSSPLPDIYYFVFRYYEPFLGLAGLLFVCLDPKAAHDDQAPWPNDDIPTSLPLASRITECQIAVFSCIMTMMNYFILGAARKHLSSNPPLQEKIVAAYFYALFFGDYAHIAISLWAYEEYRWRWSKWTSVMKAALILGLSLGIPRLFWFLGVGRYVHKRDGKKAGKYE